MTPGVTPCDAQLFRPARHCAGDGRERRETDHADRSWGGVNAVISSRALPSDALQRIRTHSGCELPHHLRQLSTLYAAFPSVESQPPWSYCLSKNVACTRVARSVSSCLLTLPECPFRHVGCAE